MIDGDGHWLEPLPVFLDYLKDVAGPSVVDKFVKRAKDVTWYDLSPEERMRRRLHRPTWWGEPAHTLDRATAMIPRLFYERLDQIGLDFCVLYTSLGLFFIGNPDEEIRRATARAVNRMNAEMFKAYAHRITPAAVVPVHTPEEAIEEATYAVRELGLKVLMIANHVRRPVPAFAREGAPLNEVRTYVDSLAFESAYDYDPFWQRCVRSEDRGDRALRQHGHQLARVGVELHLQPHRSLRQRQPRLRQGAHPGRRHPPLPAAALRHAGGRRGLGVQPRDRPRRPLGAPPPRRPWRARRNPTNLDRAELESLLREYGGARYEDKMDEMFAAMNLAEPFTSAEQADRARVQAGAFDDFAAVPVQSGEELRRHFAERFYFGCEADDPMNAWAFDRTANHGAA